MIVAPLKFPPLPNRDNNRPSQQQPSIKNTQQDSSVERMKLVPRQITSKSNNRSLDQRRPQSSQSNLSNKSRESSNDFKYSQKQRSVRQQMLNRYGQSIPNVTAKSWILFQMRQAKRICGRRTNKKREIASLTKIINLITILETLDSLKINPHKVRIQATSTACAMTGTTAQLLPSYEYTLYDLFFGMMLPSGNDAAYLIAEFGGYLLSPKGPIVLKKIGLEEFTHLMEANSNEYVNIFLKEMNFIAKKLFMHSTYLANPHGLSNTNSYSSAEDIARLCSYTMRNNTFRKIVQTQKHHFCYLKVQQPKEEDFSEYKNEQISQKIQESNTRQTKFVKCNSFWQNTNKLLESDWSGIKTGITPNAGPCLSASVVKNLNGRQYEFLVILLCSESMEARWKEAEQLVSWAVDNRLYI